MKSFKKPNAALIWTVIAGVTSVLGFIANHKKEASASSAQEERIVEKATEKVLQKLSEN